MPRTNGRVRCIWIGVGLLLLLAPHALSQQMTTAAAWSPDAVRVASRSDRHGEWATYAIAANGRGDRLLPYGLAPETLPGWAPRSTHLGLLSGCRGQIAYYWTDRTGMVPAGGAQALAAGLASEYSRGRCDAVIAVATRHLQPADTPDPTVRYLRGLAALRVFRLSLAAGDLAPLDGFAPWPDWAPARQVAAQVRTLQALCPPQVRELRRGSAAIFRVYYEEDNAWTRALLATLPQAHAQVTAFYGLDPGGTPVFVFRRSSPYNAFFEAYAECSPTEWQWAAGATGSLLFCQADANGDEPAPAGTDYFRASIAHEFSHCLLGRYVGWGPVPDWLDEGLAEECGARLAPGDYARNDEYMAEALAGAGPLPLELLEHRFYEADTTRAAYAQAFSMVRYLDARFGRGRLLRLIEVLRAVESADAAFRRVLGTDQQGVYDAWLLAARTQYGPAPEGPLAPPPQTRCSEGNPGRRRTSRSWTPHHPRLPTTRGPAGRPSPWDCSACCCSGSASRTATSSCRARGWA